MANNKPKKKWYQKWWIWLIVIIFLISAFSGNNDAKSKKNELVPFDEQFPKNDQSITDENNSDNEVVVDNTVDSVDSEDVDDTSEDQPLSFGLVAGEQGEYGELFTINKDTEFEETYYIYHIPAGTYTVTNIGEYRTQFNVCCDGIRVTEEGWEEPSDVPYVKALDVGETDIFTIEDGQYIEIHEPTKLDFVMNK